MSHTNCLTFLMFHCVTICFCDIRQILEYENKVTWIISLVEPYNAIGERDVIITNVL